MDEAAFSTLKSMTAAQRQSIPGVGSGMSSHLEKALHNVKNYTEFISCMMYGVSVETRKRIISWIKEKLKLMGRYVVILEVSVDDDYVFDLFTNGTLKSAPINNRVLKMKLDAIQSKSGCEYPIYSGFTLAQRVKDPIQHIKQLLKNCYAKQTVKVKHKYGYTIFDLR